MNMDVPIHIICIPERELRLRTADAHPSEDEECQIDNNRYPVYRAKHAGLIICLMNHKLHVCSAWLVLLPLSHQKVFR